MPDSETAPEPSKMPPLHTGFALSDEEKFLKKVL